MGPLSYMQSVVDRNVVMRPIPVLHTVKSLHNLLISCSYFVCSDSHHCQACKCSLSVIVTLSKPKDRCVPCIPQNIICAACLTLALRYKHLRHKYRMCSCHPLPVRNQDREMLKYLELDSRILIKLMLQSRIHLPLASAPKCIPVTAVITLLQDE